MIKSFKDLEIWKTSIKVVKKVYIITSNSYFRKDLPLQSQLRRASVSISSNIAEGFDRNSNKEFNRFLSIAKGSSVEVLNQIIIANELGYLENKEFIVIESELEILIKRIGSLKSAIKKRI